MKIKKGFVLRKLGNDYMAIAVGKTGEEVNGMFSINPAAAYLWNEMKQDITEEELVKKMCERYDDLTEEVARKDLKEFIEAIKIAIEE